MSLLLTDSLLDNAPCGFVSFSDDGTMVGVNRTLADMLGYTRAELEGWHLQKILPPGARVFYNTHVFPILKMHGVAEEIYIALRTKEGRDLPMLMNGVRRERGGAPLNDCVFVRMLQRHEYEDQLLQARRLAEQEGEAKSKFLSMMSHDLRTPLTAIYGHADLLATGFHGDLSEAQRSSAETIKEAARDVGRLIDDILSFAQLASGKVAVRPQPVPLIGAVERAAALIRFRIEQAGLSFRVDGCADDVTATADPDRLQQVLLNLLTNAIKFTPPGGEVTVSCERRDDRALIRVRDSGIGIPPDHLERIFDPFVQLAGGEALDPTQRGVGLGLAISRDLAHAMGGDLRAESTPGQGSLFTIDLPAESLLRQPVDSAP
jgi:PAS domain S-box-containing protein